uniref:Protein binding protein, putative n=1 Tax=Arundo donax TaxID=35708 RepID=A0A0A9E3H9_ARUDO
MMNAVPDLKRSIAWISFKSTYGIWRKKRRSRSGYKRSKQGDKRGKIVMSFVKCWKNMSLMAQLLQELGGVITVHR